MCALMGARACVCARVHVSARACVRTCVRACVRMCIYDYYIITVLYYYICGRSMCVRVCTYVHAYVYAGGCAYTDAYATARM